MSSIVVKDFDVLHKVAEEYFQHCCSDKKELVGSKHGYLVGYFYINYNSDEPIDVHKEYHSINNLLGEFDKDNLWGKIKQFEVKEAEP